MPSQISETFGKYQESLHDSKKRYEDLRIERFKNSKKFYDLFFRDLIKTYEKDNYTKVKILAEQFFQTDKVRFAAVDGSCYKKQLQDYMVFFGASYSIRGTIDFSRPKKTFKYEPWSPEEDVSMVAYVPVPFAELNHSIEDPFVVSDEEKIDLSNIHLKLMLLAEVFQNYMLVKSSDLRPKIILWDQSMSSVMNSNNLRYHDVDMIGYKYQMRELTAQDVIIAYSHPYNKIIGIPSSKKYSAYKYVLSRIQDSPQKIPDLASQLSMIPNELIRRITYLTNQGVSKNDLLRQNDPIAFLNNDELRFNIDYEGSWEYTIGLFENICTKLFKDKKPNALIYQLRTNYGKEEKWLSPNDIRFLIAIGLRALIEECWKRDVLLIGIVKDSSSKYLSRNYIGVMNDARYYPEVPHVLLPWSDRDFLENLVWIDDELNSPWSTIEFDSVFMTLHLETDRAGNNQIRGSGKEIRGVRGDIIEPNERLFSRSLAQFYLNHSKKIPLYGHVIFIDRLIIPKIEKNNEKAHISSNKYRLGIIEPYIFLDKDQKNPMQDLMMHILDILTQNLYPEIIGYPDPLHKADWGAKSLYKKIKPIIDSSDISLKTYPIHKTLRQLREEIKRT